MGNQSINQKGNSELLKQQRLGATNYNNQGCLMKVVEYNNSSDVVVEFQDEYKWKTKTTWYHFINGILYNYYYPNVYGVGITGNKYPTMTNSIKHKEYVTWCSMLQRCFNAKKKQQCSSYQNVTCCKEWLYYPNFYEWLHKQENFEVWLKTEKYCLDKDILKKGNKIYSSETCCLVPERINHLFPNAKSIRGNLPIGVSYDKNKHKYKAQCSIRDNDKTQRIIQLGLYDTAIEAFNAYKNQKEFEIKQVAQEEYNKGTISKKCYEAMMKWEVEIGD